VAIREDRQVTDKRKRAAPTIDLTATEVPSAPDETASAQNHSQEHAQEHASAPQPGPPPRARASKPKPPPPPDEPPRPAEQPAPRRRSSFGAILAAGIAGAVVAAAVLAAVWYAGLLPSGSVQSNDGRIAALQKQVQELQNRPAPAIDNQAIDALRQSVRKLETDIAKLPPGDKTVAERLTAADNAMKSLGIALAALNKRGDDIAAKAAQAQEQAAAAQKAVGDLRDSVQNAKQAASSAIDSGQLEELQKRVVAVEQSLGAARKQLVKTSATDSAARLALSAAVLRDAVMSGAPYQAELAQAKSLGADESVLAPLAQFAAHGVPDKAALAQELSLLIPVLAKASGNEAASGGFLDRLQANASKLVHIQPVDAPAGDATSDVLARVEVEAAKTDIDGALTDIAKLPEAARQQAADWVSKAVARQKALAAARRLASDAARDLGKPPSADALSKP
jgi:hypothetical protein